MIGVDLARGQFFDDGAIKDELAREHPYEEWTKNIVDLDPIIGPGPEPLMFEEKGELRRFINFYVNSEDIRFLNGKETALNAGDEVSIVPAVAGG